MQSSITMGYREKQTIGDITFQLLDAGHIPGSCQILLEAEGKRILFTGDFNTSKTRLLSPADQDYGDLDAIIIETTYADSDHTDRMELEKRFIALISEIVESGGVALVPAFSIGRSQEIACILAAYHFEYPIIIDGMARAANRVMMDNTEFLQDSRLFLDAVHGAKWIDGWKDRRTATRKPGVIISPAGMLKGGPAAGYLSKLGKKPQNAILLVSYQIPGSPGHQLMEEGKCVIDGKLKRVKALVEHFDFSSHCGAEQLKEVVKNLKGNPNVFSVHGSEDNCKGFTRWVKKNVGLKAMSPKAGDRFTI